MRTPLRHGCAVPPPLQGRLWRVQNKKAPLEGSWPRSGLRGVHAKSTRIPKQYAGVILCPRASRPTPGKYLPERLIQHLIPGVSDPPKEKAQARSFQRRPIAVLPITQLVSFPAGGVPLSHAPRLYFEFPVQAFCVSKAHPLIMLILYRGVKYLAISNWGWSFEDGKAHLLS